MDPTTQLSKAVLELSLDGKLEQASNMIGNNIANADKRIADAEKVIADAEKMRAHAQALQPLFANRVPKAQAAS